MKVNTNFENGKLLTPAKWADKLRLSYTKQLIAEFTTDYFNKSEKYEGITSHTEAFAKFFVDKFGDVDDMQESDNENEAISYEDFLGNNGGEKSAKALFQAIITILNYTI